MHHILKIEEAFFEAKIAGLKLFEIRNNRDRGFQKGDTVSYEVSNGTYYSLQKGVWEILYVTNYFQRDDYVVFGEKFLESSMEDK